MTVGGDVGHRACPAFQVRSELVSQALYALPMSRSKMAGGPCQQLRYFTGNQTGRNHLRRSADNHGLPPMGPSNPPGQTTSQRTVIVFISRAFIALSAKNTLPHSQSLWSTSTLQLQGWVSTRLAQEEHQTPPPGQGDWFRNEHGNQPVPMRVRSGTFAGTCECNTECTFLLRAQGKQ